jgi:hypothetical protein
VKIDQTVYNPARICKVPGTWARKGDDIPERPHRQSRLVEVPGCEDVSDLTSASVEPVRRELLEAVIEALTPPAETAAPTASPTPPRPPFVLHGTASNFGDHKLNIPRWLDARGVGYRQKAQPDSLGRTVYVLKVCPFDPSHGDPDSCMMQDQNGKLSARCFHDSCKGRGWQDFKKAIGAPDPDHYDPPLTSSNGHAGRKQAGQTGQDSATGKVNRLATTRLDSISAEPVRWLAPGRLPLGKLVLLAGDGGHGKSMTTLHLTTCLTRGWPAFGLSYNPPPPGEVLIASCEDDFADTVVPRLLSCGADLSRVHRIDGLENEGGPPMPFSLAHYQQLDQELAARPAVRLVIIDPAGAYIGRSGVDDHKDSELRSLLGPLSDLAAKRRVTIVLVKHLSKGATAKAVHKVGGSTGYVNAVRAAYVVCPSQDDPDTKLLLPLKFNIGPRPRGLSYRMEALLEEDRTRILGGMPHFGDEDRARLGEQLFRISWQGEVDIDADDALGAAEKRERGPNKVAKCKEWLETFLAEFAFPSDEILAAARSQGFTFDNVKEAKSALKAEKGLQHSNRGRFHGTWWSGFGAPDEWKLRPEPSVGSPADAAPLCPTSPLSPESPQSACVQSGESGETRERGESGEQTGVEAQGEDQSEVNVKASTTGGET